MYYEIELHYDKPYTFIYYYDVSITMKRMLQHAELVFGINPFFDLLFRLSQLTNITLQQNKRIYSIRYLRKSACDCLYKELMEFIRDSKTCEIL